MKLGPSSPSCFMVFVCILFVNLSQAHLEECLVKISFFVCCIRAIEPLWKRKWWTVAASLIRRVTLTVQVTFVVEEQVLLLHPTGLVGKDKASLEKNDEISKYGACQVHLKTKVHVGNIGASNGKQCSLKRGIEAGIEVVPDIHLWNRVRGVFQIPRKVGSSNNTCIKSSIKLLIHRP